jgi:DNA-binding CsgD family transcriptional regulator
VALDDFDRMFVAWNLALLAEAQALCGDTGQARQTLAQSDQNGPLAAIFSYSRVRAECAILAAEGRIGEAAARAQEGEAVAMANGLMVHALWCWYDAARFGKDGAMIDAGSLAMVDGALPESCRDHVAALAGRTGDELDRVSDAFAGTGAILYAAEAGMHAAAAHLRVGERTRASASFEQARSLLDPGDPVVTPALQSSPRVAATLTAREREVAQLAARGMSDRAIAEQLGVSVRTVETHLGRVYAKLGLSGRTGLTWVFKGSPTG